MKIDLETKIVAKGYSKLNGVHYTRIKARAKVPNNSSRSYTSDAIREKFGSYTSEYRLVKETEGYIFREVLHDNGINGHHKRMKDAIVRSLWHVTIHIDEAFEYEDTPEFKKIEGYHLARNKRCKHKNGYHDRRFGVNFCPDCGITNY